jgi:hypothetical protein
MVLLFLPGQSQLPQRCFRAGDTAGAHVQGCSGIVQPVPGLQIYVQQRSIRIGRTQQPAYIRRRNGQIFHSHRIPHHKSSVSIIIPQLSPRDNGSLGMKNIEKPESFLARHRILWFFLSKTTKKSGVSSPGMCFFAKWIRYYVQGELFPSHPVRIIPPRFR